jgi:hypothetical protein
VNLRLLLIEGSCLHVPSLGCFPKPSTKEGAVGEDGGVRVTEYVCSVSVLAMYHICWAFQFFQISHLLLDHGPVLPQAIGYRD